MAGNLSATGTDAIRFGVTLEEVFTGAAFFGAAFFGAAFFGAGLNLAVALFAPVFFGLDFFFIGIQWVW